MFDIPVVIFIFKRIKAIEIINRLAKIQPKILYIIADGGRTFEESLECQKCREAVEKAISWNCKVIKNYAELNRGVFENIGLGAKWVFRHEKKAIFLEDDNLPSISFFEFCKEMLDKYENDSRIFWICGTNYLGKTNYNDESYYFTRHMLPCGWASWADKFTKYYDPYIEDCFDNNICESIKYILHNNTLFNQYRHFWQSERNRILHDLKPLSWDYQMDFAIKANNMYGIAPAVNLIENIGVDQFSIHGGSSFKDTMTKRFCSMESFELDFPLKHPKYVTLCPKYENKVAKILIYPLTLRLKNKVVLFLRKLLKIPYGSSIHELVKRGKRK